MLLGRFYFVAFALPIRLQLTKLPVFSCLLPIIGYFHVHFICYFLLPFSGYFHVHLLYKT